MLLAHPTHSVNARTRCCDILFAQQVRIFVQQQCLAVSAYLSSLSFLSASIDSETNLISKANCHAVSWDVLHYSFMLKCCSSWPCLYDTVICNVFAIIRYLRKSNRDIFMNHIFARKNPELFLISKIDEILQVACWWYPHTQRRSTRRCIPTSAWTAA